MNLVYILAKLCSSLKITTNSIEIFNESGDTILVIDVGVCRNLGTNKEYWQISNLKKVVTVTGTDGNSLIYESDDMIPVFGREIGVNDIYAGIWRLEECILKEELEQTHYDKELEYVKEIEYVVESLSRQLPHYCVVHVRSTELWHNGDIVVPDIAVTVNSIASVQFVIEFVTESNLYILKTRKKQFYTKLGIREYWLIDVPHKKVEIYYLYGGKYRIDTLMNPTSISASELPGIHLRTEDIWNMRATPGTQK